MCVPVDAHTAHSTSVCVPVVVLILPREGEIIGSAGLLARDSEVPSFEIRYWFIRRMPDRATPRRPQARWPSSLAFDELGSGRVEIRMDENNRRSWAVAERLGLEWEATLKSHRRDYLGKLSNTRVYAMFDGRQLAPFRR